MKIKINFMKKSWILLVLMSLSLGIFAQSVSDGRDGSAAAEKMTTRMEQQLALDKDQTAQLLEVNTKYVAEMKTLTDKDAFESVEQRDAWRTEIKEGYKSSLKNILTDSQFKQFEDKIEPIERRGRKGRMGNSKDQKDIRRSESRLERMKAKREMMQNLSEEDQAKMKEGKEKVRAYSERNIIPTLQRFRAEFDANLSETERAQIAEMRKEKAEKMEAWKSKKGETCDKSKCDKTKCDAKKCDASKCEKKSEQKIEREGTTEKVVGDRPGPRGARGFNKAGGEHKEGLKKMLVNHKEGLQIVEGKIRPLAKKWQADIERIQAAYMPEAAQKLSQERRAKNEGAGKRGLGGFGKMKKYMGGVGFLMLDHKADPSTVLSHRSGGKKGPKRTCGTPPPTDKK